MNDFESRLLSSLLAEADASTRDLDVGRAAARLEARLDRVERVRRLSTWGTVLAAAAVVLMAVLLGWPTQGSGSVEPIKAPPSATTPQAYKNTGALIEPGPYRMVVGMDDSGVPIEADLTFGGHLWGAGDYPVMANSGGVAVYLPLALAAGTGCYGDALNLDVGDTPEAIAAQLAQLPDSTVVQAPAPVEKFGYATVHLQARIDQDCGDEIYAVAHTRHGAHGISYGDVTKDVVIDFWVMDLGRGDPVVVETWHQAGTPSHLVDQITATRDSIRFVTSR